MHFSTVIIGAGPAGLACAKLLGRNGIQTLVVEKNKTIGRKVCAGGLTWGGLADKIPAALIEKKFSVQHITTRYQDISIQSHHPIIVTVNREKLGQFMLEQARETGARIFSSTRVLKIENDSVLLVHGSDKRPRKITFDYLVGADGSNSLVRRYLKVPATRMGLGINYQIPGTYDRMEWHLNSKYFKNGYGWIFPHRETCSIGAYVDASFMKAQTLKRNLIRWYQGINKDLSPFRCRAEFINYDFRGWDFGHYFLAGDAAGFASAITGEGIYPAIVSGEAVARKIIDPTNNCTSINRLIKKHRFHTNMLRITGRNRLLYLMLCELLALALRSKILDFHLMEMTDR